MSILSKFNQNNQLIQENFKLPNAEGEILSSIYIYASSISVRWHPSGIGNLNFQLLPLLRFLAKVEKSAENIETNDSLLNAVKSTRRVVNLIHGIIHIKMFTIDMFFDLIASCDNNTPKHVITFSSQKIYLLLAKKFRKYVNKYGTLSNSNDLDLDLRRYFEESYLVFEYLLVFYLFLKYLNEKFDIHGLDSIISKVKNKLFAFRFEFDNFVSLNKINFQSQDYFLEDDASFMFFQEEYSYDNIFSGNVSMFINSVDDNIAYLSAFNLFELLVNEELFPAFFDC